MITYSDMDTIGDKKIYLQRSLRAMSISDFFLLTVLIILSGKLLSIASEITTFFTWVLLTAYTVSSVVFTNFSGIFLDENIITDPIRIENHEKILGNINNTLKWLLCFRYAIFLAILGIVSLLLFTPNEKDYIHGLIVSMNIIIFLYATTCLGHNYKS